MRFIRVFLNWVLLAIAPIIYLVVLPIACLLIGLWSGVTLFYEQITDVNWRGVFKLKGFLDGRRPWLIDGTKWAWQSRSKSERIKEKMRKKNASV